MRFAIFTHVEHVSKDSSYFAYGPYIREMNLWLQLVKEVEVVAPLRKELIFNAEAYRHDHLTFTSIPRFDLLSPKNALRAILKFPVIFARIVAAMDRADHLHLRCPGNIGLIACICQIFFPKKPKTAKYAGNWDPEAKQPRTYRLQKWILRNPFLTRNMQVLVYGEWDKRSKKVVPFFTASFSEKEIPEVEEKRFSGPLTFLFVGNLVPGKQPLEAVKLVEAINIVCTDKEVWSELEVYGDGPERERLERYCEENSMSEQVSFHGSRSLQELKKAYQKAHFVILPSRSEGWPKAIAEGMFYGCIPIATPVSCVPWMLDYEKHGILLGNKANSQQLKANSKQWAVDSGQGTEDVEKISRLMNNPEEMKRMSQEAKAWSQQYTVERFEEAIKDILHKSDKDLIPESGKISPAPFRDGVKRGKN